MIYDERLQLRGGNASAPRYEQQSRIPSCILAHGHYGAPITFKAFGSLPPRERHGMRLFKIVAMIGPTHDCRPVHVNLQLTMPRKPAQDDTSKRSLAGYSRQYMMFRESGRTTMLQIFSMQLNIIDE